MEGSRLSNLVPGNVVAAINEQATRRRGVVDLFAVITGVRGSAVDVPFEQDATTRAVIALPGATKENANAVWGGYSATLYTLARIFDVGNQLLRFVNPPLWVRLPPSAPALEAEKAFRYTRATVGVAPRAG